MDYANPGSTDLQQDPEVHYWKRVSAIVCASCMAAFIALLAIAGATYAPSAPSEPAARADAVAGPIHADVL